MRYNGRKNFVLALSFLYVLFIVCAAHGQFRLLNQVRIKPFNDRILAINSLRGSTIAERLEAGEKVLAYNAQGLVGLAVTNRRLLGFSAETNAWSPLRFFGHEKVTEKDLRLSPRLALVVTNRRAYIFSEAGQWSKVDLISFDFPLTYYVSENVGLVVTNTRALAFSAIQADGWKGIQLRLHEPVQNVELDDGVAALDTPHRLLIFNAWEDAWNFRTRLKGDE